MSEDNELQRDITNSNSLIQLFEQIKMNDINEPDIVIRSEIDTNDLTDLADSIKQNGLIQPIVVQKKGEKYEIIAGHRRFLAMKMLNWSKTKALISDVNSETKLMQRLDENIKRIDISPIDEGKYFDDIMNELQITQQQLSKLINRSQSYISERIQTISYDKKIKEALKAKEMTFSVAREFNQITNLQDLQNAIEYNRTQGCTPAVAKWLKDEYRQNRSRAEEDLLDDKDKNIDFTTQSYVVKSKCFICKELKELKDVMSVNICMSCIAKIK